MFLRIDPANFRELERRAEADSDADADAQKLVAQFAAAGARRSFVTIDLFVGKNRRARRAEGARRRSRAS